MSHLRLAERKAAEQLLCTVVQGTGVTVVAVGSIDHSYSNGKGFLACVSRPWTPGFALHGPVGVPVRY